MRARVSKAAHILERIGLAMAGATSGLLVGTQVGSSVAALTTQGFVLAMMVGGAIGFYLGIDTPAQTFQEANHERDGGAAQKIDSAEFLTAVGTFLATLAAFASIAVIVLRETPHLSLNLVILFGWVIGLTMQMVAGAIARLR